MGAFDRIEKGVENAVVKFSRSFRSDLKPVEIASALKKAMDDHANAIARDRTICPNSFDVHVCPADAEKIASWGEEALISELVSDATNHAASQDYTFLGPIQISFTPSDSLGEGSVEVKASVKRGPVAPALNNAPSTSHPIIDVGGARYLLTGAVTVIGRGSDCDITVDDTGVSRHHLELRVTPAGVIATDLNSTNGMFVEGHRVKAATLVDGNTLTIGHTRIMFWSSPDEG